MNNISTPIISIQNVCKTFNHLSSKKLEVLNGVNLDIYRGDSVGIIGYSGCGKTTLLRIICGFEKCDSGTVYFEGKPKFSPNKKMLMLFQGFDQLFPWKTVLQNVMHPLLATGFIKDKKSAKQHALKYLQDVELSGFENLYPHELSGGMKQRVAVARALALQPCALLLDEPFASLDNITRRSLQNLTCDVCDKHNITTVFVTHSVEEAVRMATKIVVMNRRGNIEHIFENAYRQQNDCDEKSLLVIEITKLIDALKSK